MAVINDPNTTTSVAAVKAASTAPVATDPALVVTLSPNSAAPAPTGTTTVAGAKSNNAVIPGTTNLGVLTAVCNASAPTYTDTFQVGLSCLTTGAVRSDTSSIAGTATVTAAAGVQKVGISSSTGTALEKSNNAVVPGATNLGVLTAVCNASAPTYTDTFQVGLSCLTTGAVRTDMSSVAGTATVTAAAGVQKVGVVGNANAAFDAVQGAAAPANLVWTEARLRASDLLVTNTAAVNTGFTTTLPAVASQFHYITSIQIVRATNATATAAGAALTITTTNLPGNPVWTFGNASTAGGTSVLVDLHATTPLKSSVANTNTTIVVPAAGAGEILRVNVCYYTAL